MSSTPVQPSRPLPPFSPSSPYSRPPPTSPHRRAPLLAILKTNVIGLIFLLAIRISPFYYSYRTFALRSLGLSRDWVNAAETVVVTLLVWNAFAAARKLRTSGGLQAGATLPASSVGRAASLRGTPLSNKGSPKIRPAPPSPSPLAMSSSVASRFSTSTSSSPLSASVSKPRFALPPSLPSTPVQSSSSSTPQRSLKQALNSPPHASPLAGSVGYRGSTLSHSEAALQQEVSPVKLFKMRHSLGASGLGGGDSPLR